MKYHPFAAPLSPKVKELLKATARSFYLSLIFLPAPMRSPASLGYLVARAMDTIADHPQLNHQQKDEILNRLFAFLQGLKPEGPWPQTTQITYTLDLSTAFLKHGYAIPMEVQILPQVLAEGLIDLSPALREILLKVWSKICYGMIVQNQSKSFSIHNSLELAEYCYYAAGCVGEFWSELINHFWAQPQPILPTLFALGKKCGVVLQKVNIIRDAKDDAGREHFYLPETYYKDLHLGIGVPTVKQWRVAPLLDLIEKTEKDSYSIFDWLGRIRVSQWRYALPLYFCSLLPFLLAQATLHKIKEQVLAARQHETAPLQITQAKISRITVYRLLFKAILLSFQIHHHHQSQPMENISFS